jgi:repressor LexA
VAREVTARQRAVYRFIVETVTQRGYPPTVREIGEHFDMRSTGSVRDHLSALERKGFIRRAANTSRGIELVNLQDRPGANTMAVPLLGQIAAGAPLLAVENQEDTLNVDARLFGRNGTVFALRVKGDSMRDAGILDGDVVFVRQQADAEDGQIVAARINDEATVKRYYREKDHVRLQPANDAYEPIIITPKQGEIAILGKVVGLTRSY